MKQLALLLLALPLAACATPPQQIARVRSEQLADAEANCTARISDASGPRYARCVNQYLADYDGYRLYRTPQGTLRMVYVRTPWPSPDATAAFAAPMGPPTAPPPPSPSPSPSSSASPGR